MKGYDTLKQFTEDYWLYLIAKKVESRDSCKDTTIESVLKKRIAKRMESASEQFKKTIKDNRYSRTDLNLIAIHKNSGTIRNLDDFIDYFASFNETTIKHYIQIMSSSAFKTGRLKKLYRFIPRKIKSRREFLIFM